MKEVFEKLKGRLEIESDNADDKIIEKVLIEDMRYWDGYGDGVDKAIEIVNQVAEEYKHGHFGCNSNGQHERCVDCGLRGECSHYNTEWFAEYSNSEKPNMSENLTSSDEFCEWRLCDEEANVYDTACGNSEMLFDGSPIDNNYSFCSYCGKKIKLLECTKCKWYWQNNDTENECSGYPTTCCEYVETAPYQPKGEV